MQFIAKEGKNAAQARNCEYDKSCAQMLQKLCVKYDNLIEVDNVAAVNRKIDSVKLVMLDNIGEALKNTEKIDLLNEQAQELSKQSGVFRDGAKDLKNKMWWKNMKVMIILFIINIAILVCFYLLYNNNITQMKLIIGGTISFLLMILIICVVCIPNGGTNCKKQK